MSLVNLHYKNFGLKYPIIVIVILSTGISAAYSVK